MIVLVADNPSMGAAYNMVPVMQEWDETHLLCAQPDGWREWDPGLVLTPENMARARELVACADEVIAIGVSGLHLLAKLESDLRAWRGASAFLMDQAYWRYSRQTNELMEDMGIGRVFVLPNLAPKAPAGAIPILQPVVVPDVPPRKSTDVITVVHAPGTEKKRVQKGSAMIRHVIKDVPGVLYREIVGLSHAQSLAFKDSAHIVIDQIPAKGWTHGLGMNGEEGLARGAVVLSHMYDKEVTETTPWDYPPVISVHNAEKLRATLCDLRSMGAGALVAMGWVGYRWAKAHISPEAWLARFRSYFEE